MLDSPSHEPAPCLESLHQALCPSDLEWAQDCEAPMQALLARWGLAHLLATWLEEPSGAWEGGSLWSRSLPLLFHAVQHPSLPALGVAWASVPHPDGTTSLSLSVEGAERQVPMSEGLGV